MYLNLRPSGYEGDFDNVYPFDIDEFTVSHVPLVCRRRYLASAISDSTKLFCNLSSAKLYRVRRPPSANQHQRILLAAFLRLHRTRNSLTPVSFCTGLY
jgi:hypothetical protein